MAKKQKEVSYQYVVSQRAYVDVEGDGVVRFVNEGDPVVRSTPAPKTKLHILTPVNEVAREVASGTFDLLSSNINVLKALAEMGEFDVKAVKDALKTRYKVIVRSSDPEDIIQKIMELRLGQPDKKIRVGIDDDLI